MTKEHGPHKGMDLVRGRQTKQAMDLRNERQALKADPIANEGWTWEVSAKPRFQ